MAVRVGFVGCRHVHFGALYQSITATERVEVVGLVEDDEVAREHGLSVLRTQAYADIDEMVSDAAPSVVCAATPNGPKAEVILSALERGLHVATTKPPVLRRDELDAIEAGLERTGLQLFCLKPLRVKSMFRTAREVARSGALGRVHFARVELPHGFDPETRDPYFLDPEAYGGLVLDFGWNVLDYLRWLTGSTLRSAAGFRGTAKFEELEGFDDHAVMSLSFEDGTLASATVNWTKPRGIAGPMRQVSIHGERGTFDGVETADVSADESGGARMTVTTEGGVRAVVATDGEPYRGAAEFLDAVETGASRGEASNRGIVDTMRDLLLLDESIRAV